MKSPDEINMNSENAFLLREAAKAHSDGYYEHLSHGGKGDPAEERWIEALNAGADALAYIQQLEADLEKEKLMHQHTKEPAELFLEERDAAISYIPRQCRYCVRTKVQYLKDGRLDDVCFTCITNDRCNWEWRGVKEDGK